MNTCKLQGRAVLKTHAPGRAQAEHKNWSLTGGSRQQGTGAGPESGLGVFLQPSILPVTLDPCRRRTGGRGR